MAAVYKRPTQRHNFLVDLRILYPICHDLEEEQLHRDQQHQQLRSRAVLLHKMSLHDRPRHLQPWPLNSRQDPACSVI